MNAVDDVGRLIAGAVQGADALAATASHLAREKSIDRCHQLVNQANAYLHGAERLRRAVIEADGLQQAATR